MINGFIESLPNIVVAFIVFVLFYLVGIWAKALVSHLCARYRRPRSLGLALGRLTRWLVVLLGLLIASVIVFPNFTPSQLIQFLGISSVAIGFAFRDILQNFLASILLLLTDYHYFRRRRLAGIWERVHTALRERVRLKVGRDSQPRAGVLDSQTVKTTGVGGIRSPITRYSEYTVSARSS